ncbi:MAG: hypothetical protein KBF37_05465 [Saprospiraceae bacterium]|jgi:hypothetical protein|nr:hypothetical protein [Saprospiraceae bacterium]MBP9209758.1 hypothetical protein [Saprospiraceae bacterium]MBV6474067.1 hypothetical protein [Saprospiraceae bacterium]
MKKILFFAALAFMMNGCDDDGPAASFYEYHAHIHSPEAAAIYGMGDTLVIDVEFESHTGNAVHNVKVSILDLQTNKVIYDQPTDPHVHAGSGSYAFNRNIILTDAAGYAAGKSYRLTAKVWGPSAGEEETTGTVSFSIRN